MLNPNPSSLDRARQIVQSVGEFWEVELPRWLQLSLDPAPLIDRGLVELAATELWGSANREISQFMWQRAGEILRHGWLQLRAREKPRGYAGDHEMLGAIYQQRVTDDPLGVSFDHYFLRQAAPQAVRNRMAIVRDEICGAPHKKIVVIGSGAGLEVVDGLQLMPEDERGATEFWLLDLDPAASELAEKNLLPLLPAENLHCSAENLVRLPGKRKVCEKLQDADLVVCTGFFDYLDDEQATEMLKMFWQLLRPGGQALVFNFAPWNPTRAYMEWIGNWYLLYRTRQDLDRLASIAGLSASDFEVTAEASGIDLLLRMTKSR